MLVGEELEADWEKVLVKQAPTAFRYGAQETYGSLSVQTSWKPLRMAGAAAREMLLSAAAAAWGVDRKSCRAEIGAVIHAPTGRRLTYGELAGPASRLPVPANVPLKDPKDFRLIGQRVPRVDTRSKADGSATFGIDVRVPGMLFASVLRCPVVGGKLHSFDASKAKQVSGVREVVKIGSGIGVVADSTWAAFQGRQALEVVWDEGPNSGLSLGDIERQLTQLENQPGAVARHSGDLETTLAKAEKHLEQVYRLPYLAHVTMEPMNCTADVHWDRCEIWAPTQHPALLRQEAARMCRLPTRRVVVHTTLTGGAFGRRLELDVLADPLQLSRAVARPVQVTWTREDDIQHDYYRPIAHIRMRGGLDSAGHLTAWAHRVIAPSVRARFGPLQGGYDHMVVEGAEDVPYAIPNLLIDYIMPQFPVRIGNWRTVYVAPNAFAKECFVDELAVAANRDPLALRLELLRHLPRHTAVLTLAAEKAGWGAKLPRGRGMGMAIQQCYGSVLAQVVEVAVEKDGTLRIPRIVCAADCGLVVNPDTVEAQIEGGIAQALSAALKEEVLIERGRAVPENFHNYDVLHIAGMPVVETHLIASREPPGGAGELSVPQLAPALLNAVFAATGKRIRRLPVRPADLRAS
jgi:isoquinoline 1-oxidoreductase beta subunit